MCENNPKARPSAKGKKHHSNLPKLLSFHRACCCQNFRCSCLVKGTVNLHCSPTPACQPACYGGGRVSQHCQRNQGYARAGGGMDVSGWTEMASLFHVSCPGTLISEHCRNPVPAAMVRKQLSRGCQCLSTEKEIEGHHKQWFAQTRSRHFLCRNACSTPPHTPPTLWASSCYPSLAFLLGHTAWGL